MRTTTCVSVEAPRCQPAGSPSTCHTWPGSRAKSRAYSQLRPASHALVEATPVGDRNRGRGAAVHSKQFNSRLTSRDKQDSTGTRASEQRRTAGSQTWQVPVGCKWHCRVAHVALHTSCSLSASQWVHQHAILHTIQCTCKAWCSTKACSPSCASNWPWYSSTGSTSRMSSTSALALFIVSAFSIASTASEQLA